jgi:hypothetical protein
MYTDRLGTPECSAMTKYLKRSATPSINSGRFKAIANTFRAIANTIVPCNTPMMWMAREAASGRSPKTASIHANSHMNFYRGLGEINRSQRR